MSSRFFVCALFAALVCGIIVPTASAGVWSNLPDTIARLEVMPHDRDALASIKAAESFLLRQAMVGRMPAVILLLEVYSSMVVSLDDGDRRIADIEHAIAEVLFERGEKHRAEDPFAAASSWAYAVKLDQESPALGRLRGMMQPPQQPEPGQQWVAAPDFSVFVYHPKAIFRLGCTISDPLCSDDEKSFRWVAVPGFWADSYEVSNYRYARCVAAGLCTPIQGTTSLATPVRSDEPVTRVSWHQARMYADWTERRLPSAAEWERVARGVNLQERYPWGKRKSRERANLEGRSAPDSFDAVAPVGSFDATGYGVYDIAGNVWEWVEDTYHMDALEAPRDGSAWTNGGLGRALYGGSWRRTVEVARVSSRTWQEPDVTFDDIGFRTVIDGSQDLSDLEVLYRADSWFPLPSGRSQAALVQGLDGADRAYLQRRMVTGAVIDGREIESMQIAVAILRRNPTDLVAVDLLNRVRSRLVENATFGKVAEVERGYRLYKKAVGSETKLQGALVELKKILAEFLRLEGRRLIAKENFDGARRCFEVSLELEPNHTETLGKLSSVLPSAGQIISWPDDGREMAWIPARSFFFGASKDDRRADLDEPPAHAVKVDDFWIDRFEVTNEAYRRSVETGACTPPKEPSAYDDPALQKHPVVGVTWYQAREYCVWAGKRLPSEIEREFATRCGRTTPYPWGEDYEPGHANGFGISDRWAETSPVGYFKGNQWGLFDMLGNAQEWVADKYHWDFVGSPRTGKPWTQENGAQSDDKRVLRGGSFTSPPGDLRVSWRESRDPGKTNHTIGFRCAASESSNK